MFVENDNDIIKNYCVDRYIPYQVIRKFSDLNYEGYHKILAIDHDSDKISNLIDVLSHKFGENFYITRSTPHFCEISNKKANKGSAIEFLAKKWNIKKEEIMACGDQNNDIEMLNAAGIKIAVGNSAECLKNIADFVTSDVENDGICEAIRKFIGV